jgi:IS30 family transposase
MTDLQKLYAAARVGNKRGHHAALRHVARQTGLDKDTVDRCLKRARRADQLDEKRAKVVEDLDKKYGAEAVAS